MSKCIPRIAIFASGSGSNAEQIILHGFLSSSYKTEWVITNRRKAGVIERAKKLGIATVHVTREQFYESEQILDTLLDVDYIILAGFLWLIPSYLIKAFPKRIINIHPALLPKYGGKGMYGMHVHKAVFEAKEKFSGMTIHYVSEKYDEGQIIFQATCPIEKAKRPEEVAASVLKLEHQYFPVVIENLLKENNK